MGEEVKAGVAVRYAATRQLPLRLAGVGSYPCDAARLRPSSKGSFGRSNCGRPACRTTRGDAARREGDPSFESVQRGLRRLNQTPELIRLIQIEAYSLYFVPTDRDEHHPASGNV